MSRFCILYETIIGQRNLSSDEFVRIFDFHSSNSNVEFDFFDQIRSIRPQICQNSTNLGQFWDIIKRFIAYINVLSKRQPLLSKKVVFFKAKKYIFDQIRLLHGQIQSYWNKFDRTLLLHKKGRRQRRVTSNTGTSKTVTSNSMLNNIEKKN